MTTTITSVTEVFDALQAFIDQRPRLDQNDYGMDPNGFRGFRADLRAVSTDKHRAQAALDEARGLPAREQHPTSAELLTDAFRAFSGRLEWTPKGIEYTTGQYFPTEYRKAAASVLEAYIRAYRQAVASEAGPREFSYATLDDVRAANAAIGQSWFAGDNMRFFNTRFESGLIAGRYFLTSEKRREEDRRQYSIRVARQDGSIDTLGEFGAYASREAARRAIPVVTGATAPRV